MIRRPWSRRRRYLLGPLAFGLLGQLGGSDLVEAQSSLSTWAQLRLEELNASVLQGEQGSRERLERIRAMYFLSVDEGKWVDLAKDSLSALRVSAPSASEEEVTFEAYRGALEVVRAKHSRWPPNKLKYLNEGARTLDGLVARQPDNLEVRYLRLASYLFLPFFLRRDESVAADLRTLAANLPEYPAAFSPPVYQAVVRFVLENGTLDGEERTRLERVLEDESQGNKKGRGRQDT
ncbi:hypothetical protein ACFL3S_04400 [Gemmatimonadota bacterium]